MFKVMLVLSLFFSLSTNATEPKDLYIQGYAQKAFERYNNSLEEAKSLNNLVLLFLNDPNLFTLENVKLQWIVARNVYSQTEVYRFFDSPIDDENGPEGLINAWPMDEAYIDYVDVMPESGIINDLTNYPQISEDLIISLNEADGEKNISTGWHTIEFLLWGQDKSVIGPGERPFTDYVIGSGKNADRRRQYLKIVSELLIKNLSYVTEKWDPTIKPNFAETLTSDPDAFVKVITAAKFLAAEELAIERMFVAYDIQDQEDEHSCFSDTTHNDIYYNFVGVRNVLSESYNGVSFIEILEDKDPVLAYIISTKLSSLEVKFFNFPAPFDQAIFDTKGRLQVKAIIDELVELGQYIGMGLELINLNEN